MEKIRIAIIEDSEEASDLLMNYLMRYEKEKDCDFDVRRFCDATTFLGSYNHYFDLLFMDIELPDGNGMEVVAKLREKDKEVMVIFVTNMSQYAIKGYEVNAFDFVVKPVVYSVFSIKLTSAIENMRQKRGKNIWISNKDGKIRIHTSRLKYIEVVQHVLTFHTLDGDFKQSGSLKMFEEELADEPFSLCNRCYLVNLKFVSAVKQFDVYLGNERLQISRLKRNAFMKALNDYLA